MPIAVPLSSPKASTLAARAVLAASILEICQEQLKGRNSTKVTTTRREGAKIRRQQFHQNALHDKQKVCQNENQITIKVILNYVASFDLQTFPLCFGVVWPTRDAWKIRPYLGVSCFVLSALLTQ